jgi:hypothetical protein
VRSRTHPSRRTAAAAFCCTRSSIASGRLLVVVVAVGGGAPPAGGACDTPRAMHTPSASPPHAALTFPHAVLPRAPIRPHTHLSPLPPHSSSRSRGRAGSSSSSGRRCVLQGRPAEHVLLPHARGCSQREQALVHHRRAGPDAGPPCDAGRNLHQVRGAVVCARLRVWPATLVSPHPVL